MNETFFSLWEMMEKVMVEDVGKGSLEEERQIKLFNTCFCSLNHFSWGDTRSTCIQNLKIPSDASYKPKHLAVSWWWGKKKCSGWSRGWNFFYFRSLAGLPHVSCSGAGNQLEWSWSQKAEWQLDRYALSLTQVHSVQGNRDCISLCFRPCWMVEQLNMFKYEWVFLKIIAQKWRSSLFGIYEY